MKSIFKVCIIIGILIAIIGFGFIYFVLAQSFSFDQNDDKIIGYEYLNSSGDIVNELDADTIHVWNPKHSYFFNKSSGIQITNNFQDYWTRNIFCMKYKDNNEDWIYSCNDEFNWNIKTDNLTYVNYTGWRDISIESKQVRAAIRYHLKTDDKNLTIQFSIENIGESDINTDIGFAWVTKDIQINGQKDDYIEINETSYLLNQTLNNIYTNLNDAIYTLSDKSGSSLFLKWNENLDYKLSVKSEVGQYNAPVTLDINTGTLLSGEKKETTMFWLDVDSWTFQLKVWNTYNTVTQTDDVLLGQWNITCTEGDDASTCNMGNTTILYVNNKYRLEIRGNTTEASFNYVGDKLPPSGTWINSTVSTISGISNRWNNGLDSWASWVPTDLIQASDIYFWTDENGSSGSWDTLTSDINYSKDINVFEDMQFSCPIEEDHCFISYVNTESATLDSDPENGGWTADTTSFESGKFYYWAIIFDVISDTLINLNNWSDGDVNAQTFNLGGETGDSDTQFQWNWTILFDTTFPQISIVSPTNNTNTTDTGLNVTYTYTETNIDSCWWNDDNGTNTTLASCGTNITTQTWLEGKHNITIFINDSGNNLNSTSVTFRIDTTSPVIIIPPAVTLEANNTPLNEDFNATDVVGVGNFSINWTTDFSIAINGTLINSTLLDIAVYKINVSVNDTLGNLNSTIYTVTVSDTTNPTITIVSPSNNTNSTDTGLNITYTYTELNCNTVWWENESLGGTNLTLGCGTNVTNVTWAEGKHNITVWINDTTNNVGSADVSFRIDTTAPTFTDFADREILDNEALNYDINATDTGVGLGTFGINWTSAFSIVSSTGVLTNTSTLNVSEYYINVTINDTVGNTNSDILLVNVTATDVSPPEVSLKSPTSHQNLSVSNTYFNFTATDSTALDTCQLWGNWTGTWHNNFTWVGPTSGVSNFTNLTVSDVRAKYNVWCNDTINQGAFATSNFTFTVDTTNPSMTINTANDTSEPSGDLTISINFTASDTYLKKCYFTLRNSAGLIHNYAENTSVVCSASPRSLTTLVFGTFTTQFWAEDFVGNLDDANLTFTTVASGGGGGGGGGGASAEEEEPTTTPLKSFCGDLICQAEGNDFGIKENYWNCNQDCPGVIGENLDELVFSLTQYCFDKDPSTVCFFTQMLFVSVPGLGEEALQENMTIYKEGQVCIGEICERISGKTLISNCLDGSPTSPCFWNTNISFVLLFFGGVGLLGLSFLKIQAPGKREKVSPYKYISIKYKRRKWRR